MGKFKIGSAYPEDLVFEGLVRRIGARKQAAKMYAFKYRASNPKWAGWLMFMLDRLFKIRDELAKLSSEERAKRVWSEIKSAKEDWKKLSADEKQKWIDMAKRYLEDRVKELKTIFETEEELEKLVEQAAKEIEEAVAEVVS